MPESLMDKASRPRRSKAWIYYLIIAILAIVTAFSHPATLVVAALAGGYATYIYRGGRFVIWFW